MAKKKYIMQAISDLHANGKRLETHEISDHEGLVNLNKVLLMLLEEDSK